MHLRLLFLIIMIILSALFAGKYNTPAVRKNIKEAVSKFNESVSKLEPKPLTPKEKQTELTKKLEGNLARIEKLVSQMKESKRSASSAETASQTSESKNLLSRILSNKDSAPEEEVKELIGVSEKLIDELEAVNRKINEEKNLMISGDNPNVIPCK